MTPTAGSVLAVDDDPSVRRVLSRILGNAGYDVLCFESGDAALPQLTERGGDRFDVVLTDLVMPGDLDGLGLLAQVREQALELPVIVMTGNATVQSAVDAMRLGAYDYIEKPFTVADLLLLTVERAVAHGRLRRHTRQLESELTRAGHLRGIVGESARIRDVFGLVAAVAATDATVLILGESGTGKELVARAIHDQSARSDRPFVPVNCSALPENLLESELFGYVKGAFTGAASHRQGLFEEASKGTLFLDEVGDISPALQMRLLRVLQEGEIRPVGATGARKVDVRVVAATNKNLSAAMRAGTFREDLYYRLNVVSIELPPLRDRLADLPLLVQHFIGKYAKRYGKEIRAVDAAVLDRLGRYRWPGNVRELENVIQRGIVLTSGQTLAVGALPPHLQSERVVATPATPEAPSQPWNDARVEFERRYLRSLLARVHGNLSEAARASGLDKSNLRRMLRRNGIESSDFRDDSA